VGVGGFLFLVAVFADFANDYQPETVFTLFLIPYVIFTIPVLLRVLINLGRRKVFDENLLVFLATTGALYIGMHWESVGVLLMYHIALLIESIVMKRTKKTISDNIDFKTSTANLKKGNNIQVVEPSELRPRQTIVIMPGEKIPVDAVVTLGNSMVDTKALTGEAEPAEVRVGQKIFSGCINLSGVIEARVLKVYEESTAMKILEMVGNAEEKKPEHEKGMEFFMRLYTPGVIVAGLLIMLLPPLFFQDQDSQLWLVRALTFLVAACPVGLLASIPLAYLGGVGAALKQGILVKGAVYLERLAKAETFLFDKTGTLTEGVFKVKRITSRKLPANELLRIAAYSEAFSSHPIAVSLRKAYGRRINTKKLSNMKEESGFGISGNVDGMDVVIGSSRYLGEYGIFSQPVREVGTAVHLAINGEYAGYILLADHPRPDVDRLIRWLQRRKHEVVMLSGDNERVVNEIGEELGIKTMFSSLMPEDKMDYLNIYMESQMGEGYVVFVGDGLNDALVLAEAHVGIGMGGLGADAALEAADIVLLEDEPAKIINAIRISKSVNRTVRYNIGLVLLMKVILLGLAATGLITMGRAVLVDVGVMFILMLNSFWLLKHPERNK
jgi:Cd2+/Zn2+-exporting ATPase